MYLGCKQKKFSEHGFTLIELIIVVFISILVMGSVYSVFTSQNQASVRNDAQNEMNGMINTAFNLLVKNVRMAGYRVPTSMAISPINNFGLVGGSVGSNLNGATLKTPLTTDPINQIKAGTDAALVLQTDNLCTLGNFVDNSALFTNGSTGIARICEPNCFSTLGGAPGAYPIAYQAGDILLAAGPSSLSAELRTGYLVKIVSITPNQTGYCSGANHTNVNYSGLDELNFWACPGGPPSCAGTVPVNQQAYRLEIANLYYVNAGNQFVSLPINNSFAPQVISDGVEDFQIRYDLTSTCTTAQWCSGCGNCNALGTQLNPPASLQEIRALRLGLVLRTFREDRTTNLNKGIPLALFDHAPATTADSFRRKVVTQLVRVKNLELKDL